MNTKLIFILFCILVLHFSSIGQKNDHNWVMGHYAFGTIEQIEMDTARQWTPFLLDFNMDPFEIIYFPYRRYLFEATNGNFSSNEGDLFCYTNGMQINGPDDKPIQGGDTINYNNYWRSSVYHETGEQLGFNLFQGCIMLPIKQDDKDLIFVLNMTFDSKEVRTIGIWYSIIDVACHNGKGCVVEKDKILIDAYLKNGKLQACRHANGRDWWIIAISEDNTTYYTFLLDQTGINLVNEQQIGRKLEEFDAGNASFSHKGDKYAVNDGNYWDSMGVISIFDFDRCSGLLSNPFFDTLVIPSSSVGQGIAFSPNDRYLYVNNMNDLYQYDMQDLSKPRIHLATYDGFQSDTTWGEGLFTTQFGFWAYGPDGRLYNVSGSASAQYMHIMDYPNEGGNASSFRQHALRIPNNPWSIPNFPHYRLGPLDGSSCDTLGLDNHPIAKYRYEADTIDHLRIRFTDLSYFRPETWSWDFGDGSPLVSTPSPYHTFPHNGSYNVCLTVSNENSSNTICRTITLGPSSSDDIQATTQADISLFPNPVQDILLITLGEYVPERGLLTIYDVQGHAVHHQRIYYGQNSIHLSHLPSGTYVWSLHDGNHRIQDGKIVKGM